MVPYQEQLVHQRRWFKAVSKKLKDLDLTEKDMFDRKALNSADLTTKREYS